MDGISSLPSTRRKRGPDRWWLNRSRSGQIFQLRGVLASQVVLGVLVGIVVRVE